jgi:hypothetical protein
MQVTIKFDQTNAPDVESAARATLQDIARTMVEGGTIVVEVDTDEWDTERGPFVHVLTAAIATPERPTPDLDGFLPREAFEAGWNAALDAVLGQED